MHTWPSFDTQPQRLSQGDTRRAVLNKIELWISDFNRPPVYWLNALAGTRKTTIAQMIGERTFTDGQLGTSFFCSRDFLDRSNLQFITSHLTVQLARKYANFRLILVPLVQSDPEVVHESLQPNEQVDCPAPQEICHFDCEQYAHPLMKIVLGVGLRKKPQGGYFTSKLRPFPADPCFLSDIYQFITQVT